MIKWLPQFKLDERIVLLMLFAFSFLCAEAQATAGEPSTKEASATFSGTALDSTSRRKFSLHECFSKADLENKEILVAAVNLPAAQAAKAATGGRGLGRWRHLFIAGTTLDRR